MNADLLELREALQRRLNVVADREFYDRDPAGHLEQLKSASTRVDELAEKIAPHADPMLRHYLERQSYVKALDFLNGLETK